MKYISRVLELFDLFVQVFQGLNSGLEQARSSFRALEKVKDSIGTYQGRRDQKWSRGTEGKIEQECTLSGTAKAVGRTALAVACSEGTLGSVFRTAKAVHPDRFSGTVSIYVYVA